MKRNRMACWMVVLGLLGMVAPWTVGAAERTAADLLPDTTLLYAELSHPGEVLEGITEHPLRERIEALPGVRDAYDQPQYRQFQAVLGVVETQLGGDWQSLLAAATAGGIAVGVDAETNGVALLIAANDDTTQEKILTKIVELACQEAQNQGNPDPIETAEYRGVDAYKLDKAVVAVFDRWLVATNKPDLGKCILDNFLDEGTSTLASDDRFQAARETRAEDASGWGYINIGALRDAGVAPDVFRGQTDNPVAELLLGGVLSNLQKTPYATPTLHLSQERARLEFATPHG
ncbi:MAG: hypothetical protein ACC628_25580, partial [Pirellulaceae bacterium]